MLGGAGLGGGRSVMRWTGAGLGTCRTGAGVVVISGGVVSIGAPRGSGSGTGVGATGMPPGAEIASAGSGRCSAVNTGATTNTPPARTRPSPAATTFSRPVAMASVRGCHDPGSRRRCRPAGGATGATGDTGIGTVSSTPIMGWFQGRDGKSALRYAWSLDRRPQLRKRHGTLDPSSTRPALGRTHLRSRFAYLGQRQIRPAVDLARLDLSRIALAHRDQVCLFGVF